MCFFDVDGHTQGESARAHRRRSASWLGRGLTLPGHEQTFRAGRLDSEQVIAYCRGPYCLMSFNAVQLRRAKDLKARRLKDGLPEWRLAGLPTESD